MAGTSKADCIPALERSNGGKVAWTLAMAAATVEGNAMG